MGDASPVTGAGPRDIKFVIATVSGRIIEVSVAAVALVAELRGIVEQKLALPPATYLKLLHDSQILKDEMPVRGLNCSVPLFAAVARETDVEVLLQTAGSHEGYRECLESAILQSEVAGSDAGSGGVAVVGPLPTILAVLEDMCGQPVSWKDDALRVGSAGGSLLEFSGSKGAIILPSLDASPLIAALGGASISHVTICVGLNSDAYNRGLGLVVEASTLLDVALDESRLEYYFYSGLGCDHFHGEDNLFTRRVSAVKFHPGVTGGQLRVEGLGGWSNDDVGFTPASWTSCEQRLHLMELTLGADGSNEVCLIRASANPDDERKAWRREWTRQLFDGKHFPSVWAWLDLGGQNTPPLHVGPITLRVRFIKREATDSSSA